MTTIIIIMMTIIISIIINIITIIITIICVFIISITIISITITIIGKNPTNLWIYIYRASIDLPNIVKYKMTILEKKK